MARLSESNQCNQCAAESPQCKRLSEMRKGFDARKPNRKAYRDFLNKLLQTIRRTNCKRQVVERFLKANLDKLDDNTAQVLRSWATAKLSEVEPKEARRLAANIVNFSSLVQQFRWGSRDNNLEIAITGYEVANTVFTCKAFPRQWATMQNNLGEVYRNRIRGDKPQNLEKAVEVLQDALQYTPDKFPEIRAAIQNNLGLVYRDQGQTEQAIAVHKEALKFYSSKRLSEQWADTQNYLGNAYSDQGQIDEAMEAYENALKVCIPGTEKWAEIKNNLAVEYCKKGQIAQAIASYQDNLTVYTRDKFLERWAMTQYNLGHAYSEGGQIDNAIKSYHSSLKVYTPTTFPIDCLHSGASLGNTAFAAERWSEAIKGYCVAIEALEQRRAWASTDNRRTKILEDEISIYINMVQTCIKTDQLEKAIEYVERSKARNLVERLAKRNLYPKGNIPTDALKTLDYLRQKIITKEHQLEIVQSNRSGSVGEDSQPSDPAYVKQLQRELYELQQQLDEVLNKISKVDKNFSLTQRVKRISFLEIQALLPDDKTVLIEWYILRETFVTFIITRQNPGITVWQSSPEDRQDLLNWLVEYWPDYAQASKEHWKDRLESRLHRLAEILHLEKVLTHVPNTCNRVILIPHQFLHLFPLHALPFPNQKDKCLLDKFPRGVSYAPSCQLLQLTEKQERPNFSHFFGIQNPTQDLTYANLEVQAVRRFFEPAYVLIEKNAKKDAFSTSPHTEHLCAAHCVHFSCHGKFNYESPLESKLLLADQKPLSIGEIFGLDLSQCRLVTLSACETGLTNFLSLSDEYISLPSGFLYAGSPSVVSSLWEVSDLSTAFLMIKFYENFSQCPQQEAGAVAIALNQAQKWLRNLTTEEFEKLVDKYKPQIEQIFAQMPIKKERIKARRRLEALKRQSHPFASPFYWAAFTATGL